MNCSRAKLKAKLLVEFEIELDSFPDWAEANREPTLAEIEAAVLRSRHEMDKAMVTALVNVQEAVQPVPGRRCRICGNEMRIKGRKRKYVETCLVSVEAGRDYYYRSSCRRSFFPPR